MSVTPKLPVQKTAGQSHLYRPFTPSTTLLDGALENATEHDVFRRVEAALPECGAGEFVAGYLIRDRSPVRCPVGRLPPGGAGTTLDAQITALHGADGPVSLPYGGPGLAVGVRAFGQLYGYLVVAADLTAARDQLAMLRMVAGQLAATLATIALHRRERDQARQLTALHRKLATVNQRLVDSVADLEWRATLHDALLQGSMSGTSEQRVAETVHRLTGLAVAVEDRFGNLRIWAGPDRPRQHAKPDAHRRAADLHRAVRLGRPVRDRDRFLAAIRSGREILGALALVTGRREITRQEATVLRYAAAMLAVDLAHQRSLAEAELRLRRELVADLLSGADPDGALARCAAAGHDLAGPHHVAVVSWLGVTDEALARAVTHGLTAVRMDALTAPRDGQVLLVVAGSARPRKLYEAVAGELGSATGTIAAGGLCESPTELPRSFGEASRALEIRRSSRAPHGAIMFDNLGMYRLLDLSEQGAHLERYVHEWLGPLLDYDRSHDADLTHSLFQYLECGGNYAATANALAIHRSTLRYRLQRIRQLTGLDLSEVDSRLNLHIATRAWLVLHGQTT